jgi:ATP-dependent Lon protease
VPRAARPKTPPPPSVELLDLDLLPPLDGDVAATRGDGVAGKGRLLPDILPLVPIRDNVYFPHMLFPLFVGRDRSIRAVEAAMEGYLPHGHRL